MTVMVNPVLCVVRIIQGFVKVDFSLWFKKIAHKRKSSLLSDGELLKRVQTTNEFALLEKKLLSNFLRDLFVGICYSITSSSQKVSTDDYFEVKKFHCKEIKENYITEKTLNFKDELAENGENFEIIFSEFAPKVFKQLRLMESVNTNEIIE